MSDDDRGAEVVAAGGALARAGLVDAFGHVSARDGDRARITPPVPLSQLAGLGALDTVALEADELPVGVPKEAWIHLCIYAARPDVGGICRAQPRAVTAVAGSGRPLVALHGQGAFVGSPVAVHDDARLVRSIDQGCRVAAALGDAPAVILRGNGAVTVGASPGEAAARMYVLERSAELNLACACAPAPRPLEADELRAWEQVQTEILDRLWSFLARSA